MAQKVEALPETTSPIDGGLVVISESGTSKKVTKANIVKSVKDQVDALTTTVATKVTTPAPITAGTATKITYDVRGFITGGVQATTADINPSGDRQYVTAAQSTYLGGVTVENNYAQPPIMYKHDTIPFRVVDMQIITKFISWNFLSPTQRDAMVDEVVKTGATHVSFATPYERLSTYQDWVNRARAKGLLIWHRSHRGSWEGSDGVGTLTSLTRSGTAATATASAAHGLVTGDKIWISGASPAAYNGLWTITVVNSTVFTFTIATSPTTPATGTVKFRVDWASYRDYVVNFIQTNPTLFRAGDIFGMAVESSNADQDGGVTNASFRSGLGGTFDITKYNQAQLDQVFYANQAFTNIGLKNKVYTWGTSVNVSLINLNGVAWNNTGGNPSGLGYKDFIDKFGGVVCIDHYQDASILDAPTYRAAVKADVRNFQKSFPGCYMAQGEWGYHTEQAITEQNQADVTKAVMEELWKMPELVLFNLWVQMGSTTTSYWSDVDGNITAGGKLAVRAAVIPFFNKGRLFTSWMSEGAEGANRETVNFAGSYIHAFITDNYEKARADIELIPLFGKAIRNNYIPNPSFEPTILLTGWSNYGTADTRERSTAQFNNGVASFRINNTTPKDGGIVSAPMVLPAGTYVISVYRKLSAAVDNANVVVRQVGGGGSPLGSAITTGYPGNTNWNRVFYSFTIAVQTTVEVLLGQGSYGSASDGEAFFDGVQLELGTTPGTYFDGDIVDTSQIIYNWAGVAGNSTSIELTLKKMINADGDFNLGGPAAALTDLTADGLYQGIISKGTAGATVAFGDLCYLDDQDGRWRLAAANLADSFDKKLGMCVLAGASGAATRMLLHGIIRADAKFPTLLVGHPVFMQNTAGAIANTKPPTTGNAYRIIGYGDTGDQLYFQPDGHFGYIS